MQQTDIKNKRKTKIIMAIALLLILTGLVFFLLSGGNIEIIKDLFKEDITKEEVRELLSSLGFRGYITITILSMLQVVFTFLPAEPVQVMAGVSFGLLDGVGLCLIGVFLGNTFIYILYKIFGQRITNYIEHNTEFDFESASKSPKIAFIIFILYFLPAIPYGLICFFTASLNIKYPKFLFLTLLGSIPSIFIGVGLGHIAITTSWILSLSIFLVLVVIIIVLLKNKKTVFNKINNYIKKKNQLTLEPKKAKTWFLALAALGSRIIYDRKIKIKFNNTVGKLESPSIVLCNHGSFIDFVYAGRMLRKEKPHFIAARLYFYHKWLNKILKYIGCIPKSMFSTDMENVKNCLKVLSKGEILAMMPEARLSTVGKFEGIQDTTYKFIQRSGVPVYTITLRGDYLASPKWADGARKGSFVEAQLKQLFSAQQIKELPLEAVKQEIDSALYYDEFKWLETKPEISYKCKTIAEGLENILYVCPKCGSICSIKTNKNNVYCENCDLTAQVNNRYAFVEGKPFNNFAEWFDWQVEKTKNEILQNPNYSLTSNVELRHSTKDGKGLTAFAGIGVCTLDRTGLTYKGTDNDSQIEKHFPLSQIYRLLFGAGINFEIYDGKEIWFFVPEEKRSAVIWYVASEILKENT